MEHQSHTKKRAGRQEKERAVLFQLIELYLQTGRPVSSQALQEAIGISVSSATIRNYFVSLESLGFVKQQHLSGGRVPLPKAFVEYAKYSLDRLAHEPVEKAPLLKLPDEITSNEVVTLLQRTGELISQNIGMAVALSSPRFDHDSITEMKFVFLDVQRALAVITTEFGLVHTSLMYSAHQLSHALLRKADRFARSRLFRETLEPDLFEGEELEHVRKLYQEAIASYFVSYSSVSREDMWRTGFSRLLQRKEVDDVQDISSALSIFENKNALRGFSREVVRAGQIRFWLGDDLAAYCQGEPNCAVIGVPYNVGSHSVGSIIAVGSMKLKYHDIFAFLRDSSAQLSSILTDCLLHHRMTYRMPETQALVVNGARQLALDMYRSPEHEGSV